MKKTIDGKMYNTDTAELLGSYENECCYNDFRYIKETLYRTKKGRYFLHGRGGAATRYSQKCGDNCWCNGEDIVPISITEAKEFAEAHLEADLYEYIFGKVEEA